MRFAASGLRRPSRPSVDPTAILNALADPVMVVDGEGLIDSVNMAAEQFWQASAATLQGQPLSEILPDDSPIFALIAQVRHAQHSVSEYGVTIATPKIGLRQVAIDVAAIAEAPGAVVILIQDRSIARRLDQLQHRSASRSLTAMAAMLAHEVKNPLSGIRGAAQLLEQNAADGDRELTRLICDESDRIVALVDRMETFGDERPLDRDAVNIHEVLDHVRRLASSGFARRVRIVESYDPSLPPVFGNRDLLIQALLNLMKNAAEAVPAEDGEIQLCTRYMQGVRLAIPGSGSRVDLPLAVSVIDNGPGIPEEIQPYLFDPFVSTKANGSGLGLAMVAKVVADHGGVIEFESAPRRTVFRLMLPMAPAAGAPPEEGR